MLAIQAAGRFDDEWETRVHMALPVVAGFLRPEGEAMRVAKEVLEGAPIFATYQGKDFEERSQRYIVSFIADHGGGGEVETVRTHRTDEPAGAAMATRLIGMQPGDRMLIFKAVDDVSAKMKVRIMAGFERLPSKTARAEAPPQRSRGSGAERPARTPTRAEAPAPNPNKPVVLRGLLEQLSPEDELKAKTLLTKHGWAGMDDIHDDDWEKAMYIARHAKDDWFD
ncbi:MAG: hypothetical protein K0Q89_23 [Thermomicrobiales bacterium]|jgi:hypothetical protein|nr:hypothetical protein [Thermomicrobiales bacterium]